MTISVFLTARTGLVAIAAALMFSAPSTAFAQSAPVLPISSQIASLIVASDNTAWAAIRGVHTYGFQRYTDTGPAGPIIRTADATGRFRVYFAAFSVLGPDGQPWYSARHTVLRVLADGQVIRYPLDADHEVVGMAAGVDGAMWVIERDTMTFDTFTWLRLWPDGRRDEQKIPLPAACISSPNVESVAAASGELWMVFDECGLLRVAADGTETLAALTPADITPVVMTVDQTGQTWWSGDGQVGVLPANGHASVFDPAPPTTSVGRAFSDLAVAPDNTVWFPTYSSCGITRMTAAGPAEHIPGPIVAQHVAFAADGTAWMANRTLIVHQSLGQLAANASHCDHVPPHLTISPSPNNRFALAQIRRQGGFFVTADEPAELDFSLSFQQHNDPDIKGFHLTVMTDRLSWTVGHHRELLPISAKALRRVASQVKRGKKIDAALLFITRDRSDNTRRAFNKVRPVR